MGRSIEIKSITDPDEAAIAQARVFVSCAQGVIRELRGANYSEKELMEVVAPEAVRRTNQVRKSN